MQDGKEVVRPYTPINTKVDGSMTLLIKKYDQGVMSKHVHNLREGDQLEIKGPLMKFQYAPNSNKEIGMIAGGTGITPMLQVINEIVSNPSDKTQIKLIFANIAEEDILLRSQLDDLQNKHKNLKIYHVLEKPPKNWKGGVGYVNKQMVKDWMPSPNDKNFKVLVCGPLGMMKQMTGPKNPDFSQGELTGLLKEIGYNKEQVFKY